MLNMFSYILITTICIIIQLNVIDGYCGCCAPQTSVTYNIKDLDVCPDGIVHSAIGWFGCSDECIPDLDFAQWTCGDSQFNGDVNVTGCLHAGCITSENFTVTGTTTYTGDIHFLQNVTVDGCLTAGCVISDNFTVTGTTTYTGDIHFLQNITVDGCIDASCMASNGTIQISSDVNITGCLNAQCVNTNDLTVNFTAIFNGDALFNQNVTIEGCLETSCISATNPNDTIIIDGNINNCNDGIIQTSAEIIGCVNCTLPVDYILKVCGSARFDNSVDIGDNDMIAGINDLTIGNNNTVEGSYNIIAGTANFDGVFFSGTLGTRRSIQQYMREDPPTGPNFVNGSVNILAGISDTVQGNANIISGADIIAISDLSSIQGFNINHTGFVSILHGINIDATGGAVVGIGADIFLDSDGPAFALGTNLVSTARNSFATGDFVMSTGDSCIGTGINTNCTGQASISGGERIHVGSPNSLGIGDGILDSQILGSNSILVGSGIITGSYGHALGYNLTTSADYATAIGQSTTASGQASLSGGTNSIAGGSDSFAHARNGFIGGDYAWVGGIDPVAVGTASFAFGISSTANTIACIAMGELATCGGGSKRDINEGRNIYGPYNRGVSGGGSVALGCNVTSAGAQTLATGFSSTSSGSVSSAIGDTNHAESIATIATGQCTRAADHASATMNANTVSSGFASTSVGSCNDDTVTDALFVVGNGDWASKCECNTRQNVAEFKQSVVNIYSDLDVTGTCTCDGGVAASALRYDVDEVSTLASTAPASGYNLIATSATTATWQLMSGTYLPTISGLVTISTVNVFAGTFYVRVGNIVTVHMVGQISYVPAALALAAFEFTLPIAPPGPFPGFGPSTGHITVATGESNKFGAGVVIGKPTATNAVVYVGGSTTITLGYFTLTFSYPVA